MDRDTMITFFDAWFLTQEGKDPTKAIENQEKRGQTNIVKNKRLPKKTNEYTVPSEIHFLGVSNDMPYEERRKIVDQNIFEYTREQYEKMGIKIIGEYDDLFWNVVLPEGWDIKATDHTMWNELLDDKGRKRATFFYKAAFYDRDAFTNFETRYKIATTHSANDNEDYEVWRMSDHIGLVKDGEEVIYKTACVPATGDYSKDDKIKNKLYEELEDYMKENYPDYENIQAYWD